MSTFCSTVFNELLLEGKLCDTVIRVGDVEFEVHKIILCSCSSYFRGLFCSKGSRTEQQVHTFPGVSATIMSLILKYAYTFSVVVTEENILELLAATDHFAVQGIVQACCNFLEQQLCFKTCIDIWKLAYVHNCPDLRQKAYLYILQHFEEVAGLSVNFLQLPVEQLAEFLEKDQLNVRQESSLFEIILHWIGYAPEERRGHLPTLLSKVRLLLIPTEYLINTVSQNVLVRNSPPCLTMITNTIDTLHESRMRKPLTHTRLPSFVLLAISGWENNDPTDRIEFYNVRADRWVTVNNGGKFPRAFHGCVFLHGFIYFIGGFDSGSFLRSVHQLNLVTKTWQEVGSMHLRCFVSTVALNGFIYAMGGCDRYGKLHTVERYEPDTNQWTWTAPMQERRSDTSAAALRDKVYIFGGYGQVGPLRTAECYNPHTNQWTLIAPMEIGCNAAGVVTYRNQIYVVGGHNGVEQVSDVSVYDPSSNCWHTAAPMINPRCNFGIAVLEEQLYVAGGFNSHGTMRNVERYDGNANVWHSVRDMEIPRGSVNCCVVERNPCATAYRL